MALPLPTNITVPAAAHLAHHNDVHAVVNNAAGKPVAADGIMYVKPTGNDANDGLSWGHAKQTILAAYDALPAGYGGEINFLDGSTVGGEVANQGLWIAGERDTTWPTLPAGWRAQKGCRFIGHGKNNWINTSPASMSARMVAGSGTDVNKPALWISGLGVPLMFENVMWDNHAVGARLGVDSNGTDRGIDCAFMSFRHCQWRSNNVVGYGPTIDMGYAFWVWFDRCMFHAVTSNSMLSDNRACILLTNPLGNVGGLIHISDSNFVQGGVRVKANGMTSVTMSRCVLESDGTNPVPPMFWVSEASSVSKFYLMDLEVADAPMGEPTVRIEPGWVTPEIAVVINCKNVVGPATVLSRYPSEWGRTVTNPARERQAAFWSGRVTAQHDSSRRSFAPTVVRFANLVSQDASTWSSKVGTAVVTTGQVAPDGSALAARLSVASGLDDRQLWRANRTFSVGDWVVIGTWVRAANPPAINAVTYPLFLGAGASAARFDGSESMPIGMPMRGDGEWLWIFGAARVTVAATDADTTFSLRVASTQAVDFYAPIFLHIPTGTISDNEAAELALHLQSYPDGAPAGHLSTLRGQKLLTHGGLGVGNSAAATTPGSVVKKMEVFDQTGASLGWVPIYSAIT